MTTKYYIIVALLWKLSYAIIISIIILIAVCYKSWQYVIYKLYFNWFFCWRKHSVMHIDRCLIGLLIKLSIILIHMICRDQNMPVYLYMGLHKDTRAK